MATTVQNVVNWALQDLNVIGAEETATGADSAAGLDRLNRLLDQWAAERLMMYTVTRTIWTIDTSTSYTVGSGADIDVARPIHLESVHYQDTSVSPTYERQMNPLTEDAWEAIPQRTLTGVYPTSWYYNPTYANATLHLWPVPTSSSLEGVMYAWAQVAEYDALTDTVALPPGYRRLIITNLAVELSAAFGRQPSPATVAAASDSLATVKRTNKRLMDLSIDTGALVQGRDRQYWYDIRIGP